MPLTFEDGMRLFKYSCLLLVFLIVGCSPLPATLKTDTTVFFKQAFEPAGSVAVLAGDSNHENSLEYALYRKKLESKLSEQGFTVLDTVSDAEYIALLLYAVDNGKQATIYTPIYGHKRGRAYLSGVTYNAEGKAIYAHTNYFSPSYGVIGTAASSKTKYRRTVALDIVMANTLEQEAPVKVFEGRTISHGECVAMVEVFDAMLEAMFTDFPGENGSNRKQLVEADTDCE